ncbi:ABC transporter permease [Spiroplasma corruscae]|uniref:ABC transporter permease n=1 Tax=Spiroplasma corruscae TaxID=216934 RepID=A0A222ENQ2_9MOLU|nr:ABC transporter permease [Spiroplasma corruscae]ASP28136.1 ABC transporter permease [Spiroplasma corruscae]
MKNQKPFFKNSFRNLTKNKIQLVAILFLVLLTSFIFTACFSSSSRINDSFQLFNSNEKSNIHDFVIDLDGTSYQNNYDNDKFKNVSDAEQRNNLIINYVQDKISDTENSFNFERVETRNFSLSSDKTIKAVSLNPYQTIDKLVVKEGMDLNTWKNYTLATNNYTKKWAYVSENFAKENNIAINDIVRFQDDDYGTSILVKDSEKKSVDLSKYELKDINLWIDNSEYSQENWFQVVGFGNSADFSTPILSKEKPLPNTKNEGLFYVNPENFGYKLTFYDKLYPDNEFNFTNHENKRIWYTNGELKGKETLKANSSTDIETYYVGKFDNKNASTTIINSYLTDLDVAKNINLYAIFDKKNTSNNKIVYSLNDNDYKFHNRTNFINTTLKYFKIVGLIISGITLFIAIIMLFLMIKNDLKKSFAQIGVMISLGYKKSSLLLSTSIYPVFVSLIGGLVGYFIGSGLQEVVVNIFNQFFQIEITSFSFSWVSFMVNILGIFVFLEAVTLITYFYVLNFYKPLEMIYFEHNKNTTKFNLALKKLLTNRKKFDSRFKGAVLSSSFTRLLSVFFVITTSSFLLTLGTIFPGVLKSNIDKTYGSTKYDNMVEYTSPLYNSPKSFYKTYNPSSTIDSLEDKSSLDIANMFIENNIKNTSFSPSKDLTSLNDLTYKAIDINYLKDFDLSIDSIPNQNNDEQVENYRKLTIMNLWKDLKNYKLDKYWKKESLLKVILNPKLAEENIEDLESIRIFYFKYKNSIGLDDVFKNPKRSTYFITDTNILDTSKDNKNKNLITSDDINVSEVNIPPIELTENGSIDNDETLSTSLYNYLGGSDWEERVITSIVTVYDWFQAQFYNNFQQAFLQGIYNNSPAIIKENIRENYYSNNGNYNIGFGVIPYNEKTDDIGIYINSLIKDQSVKVYGIKEDNKTLNLTNTKGDNLLNDLFTNDNSILINQSVAKRLNISIGDIIDVNHLVDVLNNKSNELDINTWDMTSLSAKNKNDDYTSFNNFYDNSVFDTKHSDWKNESINNDKLTYKNNEVYSSNLELSSETIVGPNMMTDDLSKGIISKQNLKVSQNYKVVGIVDKYGDNAAWINNEQAKIITKYDLSEKLLFNLFMKEWENPKDTNGLSDLISFIKNNINKNDAFDNFKTFTKDEATKKYWKLFENEYPLFNYKTSLDTTVTDITNSASTMSSFGDYSMFGLNGGTSNERNYSSTSSNSIDNLVSVPEAKKILQRINSTIVSIIFAIVLVWLCLSAVIILLTINLVINDNKKIISSMKILGYKDIYIAKLFIFIYVPIVIVSAIFGFIVCYFAIAALLSLFYSSIVLPMIFLWWYFIPGVIGSWLLYIVSVNLSWFSLKRLNMLHIVMGG